MSLMVIAGLREGVWSVDRSRSTLGFAIRHLGVATVTGRFESFTGRAEAHDGQLRAEAQVSPGSVVTGNAVRDARLRSEFFDAEQHPEAVLRAAGRDRGPLVGELTIRGVTRPAELLVTIRPEGDESVRMRIRGSISRADFGLDWAALRDAGRLLVADHVRLRADVVLIRAG